ncbi:MAG: hypothetical protein M1476_00910 [Candidatus Thermoplasmatota archaeon]|nr:hypothetical protein [Candidatus Thermoplasmatota archaeon]
MAYILSLMTVRTSVTVKKHKMDVFMYVDEQEPDNDRREKTSELPTTLAVFLLLQ